MKQFRQVRAVGDGWNCGKRRRPWNSSIVSLVWVAAAAVAAETVAHLNFSAESFPASSRAERVAVAAAPTTRVPAFAICRPRFNPSRFIREIQVRRRDTLNSSSSSNEGDKLRAATGIRPSLHPVTINALVTALKSRARASLTSSEAWPQETPLELAMLAGEIAAKALLQRRQQSDQEFLPPEEQAIAGRVVGVVMRLPELETLLASQCQQPGAAWIAKYNEYHSFGILGEELVSSNEALVHDRVLSDPLFVLSRAESLLALFLHTVEVPQLQDRNASVPDQSSIDFIDADRKDVLLSQIDASLQSKQDE
jgi:hypothetical protein